MTAWAYIAHKDGYWAGIISATVPKKDLSKFLGDFAGDGFSILTVNNRDEYNAALAGMQVWSKRPHSEFIKAEIVE